MQTPAQAARRRDDSGARLPQPWASAAAQSVFFRRGQLAMLVAAPGVGKSVVTTAYVVQSGAHTLYLSMDTDAYTTSVRLIASELGCTLSEAEAGRSARAPWALEALGKIRNVHFGFPSSPDEREIAERLLAYREAEGEYPELLILDNLSNIAFDDEEFTGFRRLMRELQTVASRTGTAILVLHHAVGEYENGDKPIPMGGVSGKLSKFPALILTAYRQEGNALGFSVVKNRFGPASPSGGGVMFSLQADMERVQIRDNPHPTLWRRNGEQ
jgi:KaiC/GvpD/RAD55 family RecA-like ATPase